MNKTSCNKLSALTATLSPALHHLLDRLVIGLELLGRENSLERSLSLLLTLLPVATVEVHTLALTLLTCSTQRITHSLHLVGISQEELVHSTVLLGTGFADLVDALHLTSSLLLGFHSATAHLILCLSTNGQQHG